jgi:hypothetical protein
MLLFLGPTAVKLKYALLLRELCNVVKDEVEVMSWGVSYGISAMVAIYKTSVYKSI